MAGHVVGDDEVEEGVDLARESSVRITWWHSPATDANDANDANDATAANGYWMIRKDVALFHSAIHWQCNMRPNGRSFRLG